MQESLLASALIKASEEQIISLVSDDSENLLLYVFLSFFLFN